MCRNRTVPGPPRQARRLRAAPLRLLSEWSLWRGAASRHRTTSRSRWQCLPALLHLAAQARICMQDARYPGHHHFLACLCIESLPPAVVLRRLQTTSR
jgi:hypothetical protein